MSDRLIKKSFRCSELYQIVIDKAKKIYKYGTDTDVILFALRMLRDKITQNLDLPEDEQFSSRRKEVDLSSGFQKKWIKEWKEDNL